MKHPLILAALIAAPVLAQVPAGPSKIQIEVAPGSTLTDNVRPSTTNRNVTITRNPQDEVTATFPVHMHQGLRVDLSAVPAPFPGYGEVRIKDTTEEPVTTSDGAFRAQCQFAKIADVDPIVYPGMPVKSHTHTFFGNADIDPWSDVTTLTTTGNSTCKGGIANRSSYWVPTLIDIETSRPMLPEAMFTYYKASRFTQHGQTPRPGQPTIHFENLPIGLKIVAGDPQRQTPATGSNAMAYRWTCGTTFAYHIPQDPAACPVGSTLTQEIFFPQCWDGQNLDSPDHKSHMSYTVNVKNVGTSGFHAECPPTHPKVLPGISFQVRYTVTVDVRRLRLVSDVNTANLPGITSHGDVFVAWKKEVADMFVENCIRAGKECAAHLLGKDSTGQLKALY